MSMFINYFNFIIFSFLILSCSKKKNSTPLFNNYEPIHWAASNNWIEDDKIVKHIDSNTNIKEYQAMDGLRSLIKKKVNLNARTKTNQGWTAVYKAAEKGYYEFLSLLLDNNADPNLERFDDGRTPLVIAIEKFNNKCALRLLKDKRTNLLLYRKNAASPLYTSILYNNEVMFNKLIELGVDYNAYCKDLKYTALQMCIYDNNFNAFKKLIKLKDIKINKGVHLEGYITPLYIACEKNKQEYIRELLKVKGADIKNKFVNNYLFKNDFIKEEEEEEKE